MISERCLTLSSTVLGSSVIHPMQGNPRFRGPPWKEVSFRTCTYHYTSAQIVECLQCSPNPAPIVLELDITDVMERWWQYRGSFARIIWRVIVQHWVGQLKLILITLQTSKGVEELSSQQRITFEWTLPANLKNYKLQAFPWRTKPELPVKHTSCKTEYVVFWIRKIQWKCIMSLYTAKQVNISICWFSKELKPNEWIQRIEAAIIQ